MLTYRTIAVCLAVEDNILAVAYGLGDGLLLGNKLRNRYPVYRVTTVRCYIRYSVLVLTGLGQGLTAAPQVGVAGTQVDRCIRLGILRPYCQVQLVDRIACVRITANQSIHLMRGFCQSLHECNLVSLAVFHGPVITLTVAYVRIRHNRCRRVFHSQVQLEYRVATLHGQRIRMNIIIYAILTSREVQTAPAERLVFAYGLVLHYLVLLAYGQYKAIYGVTTVNSLIDAVYRMHTRTLACAGDIHRRMRTVVPLIGLALAYLGFGREQERVAYAELFGIRHAPAACLGLRLEFKFVVRAYRQRVYVNRKRTSAVRSKYCTAAGVTGYRQVATI